MPPSTPGSSARPRAPDRLIPTLIWRRTAGAPPAGLAASTAVVCLASAGHLYAPSEVAGRAGVAPTLTDGDLAAALWTRVGDDCPRLLAGTLSGVFWDGSARRLLLLRDRLGLQPLVYAERGDEVGVAAEAAALLARLGVAPEPHAPALVAHLHGHPPAPGETCFSAVRAVAPGEWVEVTSRAVVRRRYWRLEPGPVLPPAERGEAVRTALLEAVGSAVPRRGFILTLSGGLDTPAIAALLRDLRPRAALTALTWSLGELPQADESAAARRVAERLDLDHHLLPADELWPLSAPGGLATRRETPFVPYYSELWEATFAWLRERGADGLVSGAGGDHLFGFGGLGAYAYPDLLLTGRWLELARQLAAHRRASPASLARILDLDLLRPLYHLARGALGGGPRVKPLPWLGAAGRAVGWQPPSAEPAGRLLPGRRHRLGLLRHPSVGWFAVEMAQRAAAHGLAARHPLLDHRLFEVAARLPGTASYHAGYHKVALREAVGDRLPESVRGARTKTVPLALFHRGVRERGTAKLWPLLHDMRAADLGLVDEARLRAAFAAYLQGGAEFRFWHAASLEDWLRRHF